MPSRRTILAGLSGTLVGMAGCGALSGVPGYIQSKHIDGWPENGPNETVLGVGYDHQTNDVDSGVADRWERYVDDIDAPTISDTFHEALQREYQEVWYQARFCSEQAASYGCILDFVDRDDFNRVQVPDRVRAKHLDEDNRIEVYSVLGTQTFTDTEDEFSRTPSFLSR
jgi:hypothetical protein